MATTLDIINKQKYEFRHLMIGDIFRVNDHTFIKIKEASIDGSRKESDPDAINLENGHYCVLGGGTICELIKPLYSEELYKRLTMSEIYKLPEEGRTIYFLPSMANPLNPFISLGEFPMGNFTNNLNAILAYQPKELGRSVKFYIPL